jgi:hypothetical protein
MAIRSGNRETREEALLREMLEVELATPSPAAAGAATQKVFTEEDFSKDEEGDTRIAINRSRLGPKSEPCSVCFDEDCPTYSMAHGCSHKYCVDCAVLLTQNGLQRGSKGIGHCHACYRPDAAPTGAAPACPPGIPSAARGAFDPMLLRVALKETPTNRRRALEYIEKLGGRQLMPFIASPSAALSTPVRCPGCAVTVSVSEVAPNIRRCLNSNCALLFCGACLLPSHPGSSCQEAGHAERSAGAQRDEEYKKAYTKPCPACGVPTEHWLAHGCHHIICRNEKCIANWCYKCGKGYTPDANHVPCGDVCRPGCGCIPCIYCAPGKPCTDCDGCEACS